MSRVRETTSENVRTSQGIGLGIALSLLCWLLAYYILF
jgi:hypothetical protein